MKKIFLGTMAAAAAMLVTAAPASATGVIQCESDNGLPDLGGCTINFTGTTTGGFGGYFDTSVLAQSFTDIYEITLAQSGLLGIGLTTTGVAGSDIDFTVVVLTEGVVPYTVIGGLTQTGFDPMSEQYAGLFGLEAGTYRISLTASSPAGFTGGSYLGDLSFTSVPEPATWAMMLAGFGAVGYSLRRRKAYKLVQAV